VCDISETPANAPPSAADAKVDDFIQAFNRNEVAIATQYAQQLARGRQSVAFALDMINKQMRRPRPAPVKPLK
jgi:hypothetical protein